ncbi:MAG: SusC/RagA family TonB-linked outer membrane protein [Saprospiraceae bacterium]|nr:SusC/RagA family TonB-linked outer membrane protein [Saprospiraceae bacterium]
MKQKKSRYFLLSLLITLTSALIAQKTVSGTVLDAKTGDPLIGANIIVPNTSTGTISDFDGTFSFVVADDVTQLEVSYIGYKPMLIAAGVGVNVSLAEGEILDEVVVIGYGTVKREDATGSVQTVNAASFNQGAITSPQDLITGKIAGVQITGASDPGGASTIRIRGGSSLSASNDPLIVIDGLPITNDGIGGERNVLNIVNPNDIETFTVLKDASATAIYGSRASNGVIIITTKKGKLGRKPSVNYSGNYNISNAINTIDVLDATQYRSLIETRYPEGHPARTLMGSANTNWQDQIYAPAGGFDHSLSFGGGVGQLPFRLSLGYTNKDGILKSDNFKRTTVALNLNPSFLDNTLQVNLSAKTMFSKNNFANRGAIGAAISYDPTQTINSSDANLFGGYTTWLQPNGQPITIATANPVALLNQRSDKSDVRRVVLTGQVDYRMPFLPDLRANLNLSVDRADGEGNIFTPENAGFLQGGDGPGFKSAYSNDNTNKLLEFYLDYGKTFNKNKLSLLAGYSWQHNKLGSASKTSNAPGTNVLFNDTDAKEYYLLSVYGRANLNVGERLLITGTLRSDGTSRFSPDSRWGLFPSAAVGYKIFDGNGEGKLSNLKARFGYGVTGQQDIGADFYPYLSRYVTSTGDADYQLGNGYINTIRPGGYNAGIKWEETATLNFALDYGLFDDRISGSIEYYIRNTTDLLNYVPVPAGTNLTNFLVTNVGDLQNKGVEFSISANPIRKAKQNLDLTFNVTANKNKITRLTATEDPTYQGVATGGISGGVGNNIQIHSVGYPASSFFVYEQVYAKDGKPIEGLYVDRNQDGTITPDDRYRYKSPNADFFMGFSAKYTIDKFDVGFSARANVGNHVYNNVLSNSGLYNNLYNSAGYINNVVSGTEGVDFKNAQYFSDHYINNASFLRFDNITLGYQLPTVSVFKGARLWATVQNPILVTNYEGIDPEISGGIDNNFYPRSRTFLFGLSFNL